MTISGINQLPSTMKDIVINKIRVAIEKRLITLDIGNCNLDHLPEEIYELIWLERLNIGTSYYNHETLSWQNSTNIGHPNQLSSNELKNLKKLPKLKQLDANDCFLEDVKFADELVSLTSLSLNNNKINKLINFSNITNLKQLDVSNNLLQEVNLLSESTTLQSLNISHNKIIDLSFASNLNQLVSLDLSYNRINDPRYLSNIPQLSSLNISHNPISDLNNLSAHKNINYLNITNNPLRDIYFLSDLINLKSLKARNTRLKEVQVLETLTKLEILDLSYNRIIEILSLRHLDNLLTLDLSNNPITDISPLNKLSNLNNLSLNNTRINDLSELKKYTKLLSLNLANSNIKDISPLYSLKNLKSLVLRKNHINSTDQFVNLPNLEHLDISHNNITDVDNIINHTPIRTLDLSNNQIKEINKVSEKSKLKLLALNHNLIEDITPLLPLIKNGMSIKWKEWTYEDNGLFLKDCPLIKPSVDLVKAGKEVILNYFKQIEEQGGTVPLYEAKLTIVGEPGAGKTSLTEKLVDDTHIVIPDDPKKKSTLGITVRDNWRFPDYKRPGKYFVSHIWDFGGQEIQYMTHQFFLTPESLYVLVADDRKQHTLFTYWFEVINLLGKDEHGNLSPIIVVLNERNNKSISNFDINEFRLKYPDTRIDVLEVDLSDTALDRFHTLKDKIQQSLCSLKHIGRPLPLMWTPIREEIFKLAISKNFISENEFAQICASYNIKKQDDRQLISKYLHQLGAILHFQNDLHLRDFIIINPKWALKAVYAVLENKDVEKRNGLFSENDLETYWKDLTNDEKSKVLSLMKRDSFEICYPIGNKSYIAPQLLPSIRPSFNWSSNRTLKFHLFYRFMPKGIITRLIVRKNEDVEDHDMVWARGAIFNRFECRILITEEEIERNGLIVIDIDGKVNNRIRALNFIRDEIEDIHSKWFSNIEYEERAPCNCVDCINSEKPSFFAWKKLIQRLDQQRETIECDNIHVKDVNVLSLLEGIYDKDYISQNLKYRKNLYKENFNSDQSSTILQPVEGDNENQPITVTRQQVMLNFYKKNKGLVFFTVFTLLAFFAFASSDSELELFGIFRAKQGENHQKENTVLTYTVVGTIKINNQVVKPETINKIFIKGSTTGRRVSLDNNNSFRIREVVIPQDNLVSIAIQLVDNREFTSESFYLPKPNDHKVIDLEEILIDVAPSQRKQQKGRQRNTGQKIIIVNRNIQNQ